MLRDRGLVLQQRGVTCHGASDDRTIRLWDLVGGRCVLTVPVHREALAVAVMDDSLAVGLRGGVLVIDLDPDQLARWLPAWR